ncbi:helix-turn-helix domain-containing protein [Arhodomonas sp. SL1]|uniref:helix-turn-helix domain-containing protein n=1 Tax=Arhodomonas sp. SL1 TaxID=3425691 RepID=UPI003F88192F
MIRFRLKELMADKSFTEGRRVTYEEISAETGINRTTLSKIANVKGYNTTTDNLDALCRYFGCSVGDVAEYVEE